MTNPNVRNALLYLKLLMLDNFSNNILIEMPQTIKNHISRHHNQPKDWDAQLDRIGVDAIRATIHWLPVLTLLH